ncbi:MAG: hypothetical protein ACPGF7_10170 [Pontibacterium sp.]
MDKYAMISFVPSVVIVVAMLVMTVAGIKFLKKSIAKDEAAAAAKSQ